MRGKTLLPPAPSTKLTCHPSNVAAASLANERAAGAAVYGWAPNTRT
jgi:hypothetical protein